MVRDYPCYLKYNVLCFYIIQYHHSSLLSELSQLIGNTIVNNQINGNHCSSALYL